MNHSESLTELAGALAKAQGAMKAALKDAQNPHLRTMYADLASVWEAMRQPLSENGLSIVQGVESTKDTVTVTTMLVHASGQWMRSSLSADITETNKGITAIQKMGSIITYLRRYAAAALVGVVQDDDDGEAGRGKNDAERLGERIANGSGDAQAQQHRAQINRMVQAFKSINVPLEKVLEFARVKKVDDLSDSHLDSLRKTYDELRAQSQHGG